MTGESTVNKLFSIFSENCGLIIMINSKDSHQVNQRSEVVTENMFLLYIYLKISDIYYSYKSARACLCYVDIRRSLRAVNAWHKGCDRCQDCIKSPDHDRISVLASSCDFLTEINQRLQASFSEFPSKRITKTPQAKNTRQT